MCACNPSIRSPYCNKCKPTHLNKESKWISVPSELIGDVVELVAEHKNSFTPSKTAKQLGCKSLVQVSEVTKVHVNTLKGWHKEKPELFEVVCLGVISKMQHLSQNKNQ